MGIIMLLLIIISCFLDISIIFYAFSNFLNFENIQNFYKNFIPNYLNIFIFINIFFIVIFLINMILNFIKLGYAGGGPQFRCQTFSNLIVSGVKMMLSIISTAILLVTLWQGNVVFYIILSVIGIIFLIYLGLKFYWTIEGFIYKLHNLK